MPYKELPRYKDEGDLSVELHLEKLFSYLSRELDYTQDLRSLVQQELLTIYKHLESIGSTQANHMLINIIEHMGHMAREDILIKLAVVTAILSNEAIKALTHKYTQDLYAILESYKHSEDRSSLHIEILDLCINITSITPPGEVKALLMSLATYIKNTKDIDTDQVTTSLEELYTTYSAYTSDV